MLRFLVGSVGFALVLLSVIGAIGTGPTACLTIGREWGSWCGTASAAASITLIEGGVLVIGGTFIGTALCRRCNYLPQAARSLSLVAVAVFATCFVFAFFVLPAVARFSR